MENIEVLFRHVGIRTEAGEISGICLGYPNEESARAVFALFHEYITSQADEKSMRVEFSKEVIGTYSLMIDVVTLQRTCEIRISGIDSSYIEKIKESLTKFTYYVILVGYEEHGEFHLLPCSEFHIFKRDVVIDGEVILGTTECDVNWLSVLK